jgi:hypothetical protein
MRNQGLAWLSQDDFAVGAVRSVARHLIPASGVYTIENGLLDADGSIYRRGGSEYVSNAAFGSGGLRWVWDGHLPAGARTVFANSADFGVLAADGVTPVNLGGAGLAAPVRAVVVGGMLFIPGGTIYGGSRKAADYSAGTVSATLGSKVITGAGTAWLANVDAGMLLRVLGVTRYYAVASVDSDTQITLVDAYESGTGAGAAYTLTRLGSAAAPYRVSEVYATVAERLVTVEGAQVRFSAARSELGVLRPHVFDLTDLHELPDGATGLGAEAIRDLLVVFATDGVWSVSNMTFDLTDAAGNAQQSIQRTSQDVLLWGPAGVASYGGALVVPAVDGVYLVDGVSQPVSVSESITPLLVEHVRAGRKPGGAAVFKGHYFLPVLDASNLVVDLLVCRLDRPAKARGRVFFPWSWFRGHGGDVAALAQRVSSSATRQPELVAAGRTDGRVLKLSAVFAPSAARKADADGSVHRWLVESRDFATGSGNVNTVRRARSRYELVDGAAGALSDALNFVLQPGFEASVVGGNPLGWTIQPGPPVGTAVSAVSDAWAATGSKSYRFAGTLGGSMLLTQTFATTVGEALGFGFTRRIGAVVGAGSCHLSVVFLDAGAAVVAEATVGAGDVLVAGAVEALASSVVVPATAVSCRVAVVFASSIAGELEAWADAVWVGSPSPLLTGAPVIRGFYSVGLASGVGSLWGSFAWGRGRWADASLEEFVPMSQPAPVNSGRDRRGFGGFAASGRHVRLRLQSTDPAATLVLRSMEVAIRPSAKDR